MKKRKNIIRTVAWVLLVAFMSTYLIKDFHSHHDEHADLHVEKHCNDHHINTDCFICDFNFCQAETPKTLTFQPFLSFTIHTPYIATVQIVYRDILTINSHSPPARA